MSVPRKRSSSPQPELTRRTSTYHPAVTLFEFSTPQDLLEDAETECSPRRSKRLRTGADAVAKVEETIEGEALERNEKIGGFDGATVIHDMALPSLQSTSPGPSKGRKPLTDASSPRKRSKANLYGQVSTLSVPPMWREAYDRIKAMRSRIVAPVDTMGAGAAKLGETIPKNQRFATLVSLMLSSQTKDEVTSAAVRKLREAVGGSLSANAVVATDADVISEAICKVGFWRRKTDYIKRTARRLSDEFGGDIPKTVDELCSLPGVGPKMAILALHVGWKINAGVGVDVHVHRVTNRLGWHTPPTKTPEETRLNLECWLPEDLRPTFTGLLVGFGQTTCLPVSPRCDCCELNDGLCPSGSSATLRRKEGPRMAASKRVHASSRPMLEVELQGEVKVRRDTTRSRNSTGEGEGCSSVDRAS
ncbi:DNA glycosylase [Fomitopsis serialis]|uniref:DNA glycosylase n=1 Tax=Fomitopsis serialis TaxID=139415 RepID=UPI0020084B66|nr:DNA glycosylase [Neoantrodia serialis]KAH9930841.1 DNA glycosylase [Neoantrodia serialis]